MNARLKVAVALLAGAAFTALLGFGMTRDPRGIPSPLIGRPAPDFDLGTLGGEDSVSLGDARGVVTVLNFWASWCLACRQEHPALVRAWERYEVSGKGVRFLGIVYQDTRANAERYMQRHGGGWTNLLDPDTRVAIDFGVYGVPETYFIGPDGRIAHKHAGPVTDRLLVEQIERLLAATPTAPTAGADDETGFTPGSP